MKKTIFFLLFFFFFSLSTDSSESNQKKENIRLSLLKKENPQTLKQFYNGKADHPHYQHGKKLHKK